MSQHDMDIANQAGAAFRADLNDALKALVGNNSGTSAPATTFKYQFWADESAGVLKIRNAANTAWVSVGLLGVANFGHIQPGDILFHAKNAAPPGFLKCNGGAISRTTYADLFAEIGTTFGAGDGSTTFNLPELRGEFPRFWDDARGIDASRVFGSAQGDLVKTHAHPSLAALYNQFNTVTGFASGTNATVFQGTGNPAVTGDNYSGGAENRPRNVALLGIIKY